MKIFISFIGNNDCDPFKNPGAILSVLEQMQFDVACLLYNHEKYLKPAGEITRYCAERYPDLKLTIIKSLAGNPIDYNTVYPAMYRAAQEIKSEYPLSEFTISLTSGTPVMHACWVFLREGGVIDAKLIQVSRESEISEVGFELDDFPEICQVDEIKAELTRLSRENRSLRRQIGLCFDNIIGESPGILKIKEQIRIFADTNLSIFIKGESGTGKELVAEAIHYNSSRKERPLVKVNCGAIPTELFESEFFGHKKGAFTGAVNDKSGYLKQADGGTIFLDEIADLPLSMQVKLLRFADSGTFTPVGGAEKRADARIISATHQKIRNLVQTGKFREDLFYRLVHTEIDLPPLQDRGIDKLLIANHIVDRQNRKYVKRKALDKSAIKLIMASPWRGNVRQLKNVLETAFVFPDSEIAAENMKIIDIDSNPSTTIQIPDAGIDLDNGVIPKYYDAALRMTGGNASKAAGLSGLKPHTFRARLKRTMR